MSEKRRGLGRGLGALIPSVPAKGAGDRPVDDVFFRDPTPREAPTATVTLDRPAETATPAVDPADLATLDRPGQVDEVVAFTQPAVGDLPVFVDVPADAVATVTEAEEEPTDPDDDLVPVPGARFAEIPVDAIRPNPRQPRQVFDDEELAELVHSIREIGVLQPIVVRSCPSPDDSPRYELVMGERRWRATQEAGFATIPAIIRDTADDDLLRDALLENLHRSQLNPLEEAAAYQQLLDDFGCTHEQLAGRLGRSRPQISNTIRLLRLPPLVQRRVAAGVLSAGHARALLGLEDGSSMEALAQRIVSEGLSVRAVEEIVSMGDAPSRAVKRAPRAGGQHSELDDLAGRLGDRLDTRVAIALGRRKGKLSIEFASVEDLNRILGLMAPDLRGLFASE